MILPKRLILFAIALIVLNISFGQTMNTKSITINTDTLSYIDNGKGDITLVFIHGSFIRKEYWEKQVSYFLSSYRVIALDLAGHGNSINSGNEWTIKRFGMDVTELIEKLSLENVILIGHSFGGDIMLEKTILKIGEAKRKI